MSSTSALLLALHGAFMRMCLIDVRGKKYQFCVCLSLKGVATN